ncbi:DUF502 domain-containing protein [Methylomonas sp. AM2-LC]|uniref:DUF502 domain-containing protein n=1 Tax=Methylomonas sp. AM2-LC TaxID=3153301 RepID=UPI0032672B66
MKRISNTFFKGLIAIIPLILTCYLLLWLADTGEMVLANIFKFFFPNSWYIKGFGVVLGLAVAYFFGLFLETLTFLRLFNRFEGGVLRIPVFKSIYTAIRDFISLFSSEQKGKLKQVVLVNIPSGYGQQIGFVTVSDFEEISHTFIADDQIAVYLPFSYAIGGNTVILSRENVVEIDISIEDALRFIATAGVVGYVNDDKNNH